MSAGGLGVHEFTVVSNESVADGLMGSSCRRPSWPARFSPASS